MTKSKHDEPAEDEESGEEETGESIALAALKTKGCKVTSQETLDDGNTRIIATTPSESTFAVIVGDELVFFFSPLGASEEHLRAMLIASSEMHWTAVTLQKEDSGTYEVGLQSMFPLNGFTEGIAADALDEHISLAKIWSGKTGHKPKPHKHKSSHKKH